MGSRFRNILGGAPLVMYPILVTRKRTKATKRRLLMLITELEIEYP